MAFVASFPHLSASEFNLACQELVLRFEKARQTNGRWESVETKVHNHETYLRISNSLPLPENRAAKDSTEEMPDEVETAEDDEEAVVPQRDSLPIIHYDILLSPTYQVPVLYFHISDSLHRFPSTLTTLYSHVVPAEFTAQTKHIGVLGGITINDHPLLGRPVFFIHPCRTAEVMEASRGGREVSSYEYMLLWIGAMGRCVGLNTPLELMKAYHNTN